MSAPAIQVVLPSQVEPEGLQLREQQPLTPAAGEVLLRMEATGVSFAEQQMLRGTYFNQPAFPFVPGYDLVGTAVAVGSGVDPSAIGQRFAAVTKIGAWATHVAVPRASLLTVPAELDSSEVEALLVNGITAWQMLHQSAAIQKGETIVVLGANGGVGSTLVQLARHAGIRVIGTASRRHHALLEDLGVEAVDHHDPDMYEQIRRLAPDGVDAVFDHVGGQGLVNSWRLLRRGGSLVSYGSASTMDSGKGGNLPLLQLLARLVVWNVMPNGKSAQLFNLWAGNRRPERFIARQQDALSNVLRILASGEIRPRIAARFPLAEILSAVQLAESRTVAGKVVVVADA